MATTINKQRNISTVFTALTKMVKAVEELPARPVLEQFVYAVCREGTTRAQADQAFAALQAKFFDWNEIRVSGPEEIAEVLEGLTPQPLTRAQRIIDFLQEVFETAFSFDLESLQKKGAKPAEKQLARYQAANDFAVAWVSQQSLGGHTVPLDSVALRVLRRWQLIDDESTLASIQTNLEAQIPKAKGTQFVDLLSVVGLDYCHEERPDCANCPARSQCPTGQDAKPHSASKKPR